MLFNSIRRWYVDQRVKIEKGGTLLRVETVAQFGVVFLLFALGLEFSLPKLKAVGPVAVLGGLLQIIIFMFLCGVTAMLCGAKLSEGVFVGSFLSMSSTAVVVKFLVERNTNNALHGQVTIGTLILQDCAVGLLFALLPVLGGNSGLLQGMISMGKLLLVLSMFLTAASVLSWSFVPRFLKLMIQLSSQVSLRTDYVPKEHDGMCRNKDEGLCSKLKC
ncbi:K(+) efflux antiporter 5 [Vitis vinifera]|uniref:K(+) efflux antiporter 5 n=1 Tax=Vitis vinifera TaxID=29760 RepID=A0A438EEN8_VITVI|nr:K(+) efflux antiporter 5 [Vitis vinifera]